MHRSRPSADCWHPDSRVQLVARFARRPVVATRAAVVTGAARPAVGPDLDELAADAGAATGASSTSPGRSAGSSTSEKSGRMSMCAEVVAARGRPRWRARRRSGAARPAAACRPRCGTAPSACRCAGAPLAALGRRAGCGRRALRSPRSRAPRSSRSKRCAQVVLAESSSGVVALRDDRERGRDIGLRHVVVLDVVGDDVAEARRSGRPGSSAAVIASSKRARRVTLTSSTVGSCICVSGWRVAFSIASSRRRSRGVTKLIAAPLRPARPVRPMRCTYDSVSIGMS